MPQVHSSTYHWKCHIKWWWDWSLWTWKIGLRLMCFTTKKWPCDGKFWRLESQLPSQAKLGPRRRIGRCWRCWQSFFQCSFQTGLRKVEIHCIICQVENLSTFWIGNLTHSKSQHVSSRWVLGISSQNASGGLLLWVSDVTDPEGFDIFVVLNQLFGNSDSFSMTALTHTSSFWTLQLLNINQKEKNCNVFDW